MSYILSEGGIGIMEEVKNISLKLYGINELLVRKQVVIRHHRGRMDETTSPMTRWTTPVQVAYSLRR
jgi:hypothetical protein